MPRKSVSKGKPGKRAIDRYEHSDKQRVNNPPVGLVTPDTDPPLPTHKIYDYATPVPSVPVGRTLLSASPDDDVPARRTGVSALHTAVLQDGHRLGQDHPHVHADDPGIFVELPLVNQIRPRVRLWREAGYPGASGITKRLLQHWRDSEQRDPNRRFFFCQLEAIETLMWLTEAPASERVGIEIPRDGGPFPYRVAGLEQSHLPAGQAIFQEHSGDRAGAYRQE